MNTIKKIETFCAVLLFILMIVVLLVFMVCCLSGCSAIAYNEEVKVGIVDSCYTVLEYEYGDREKIRKYLDVKVEKKDITLSERLMIDRCIERTINSKRWTR